MLPLRLVHPEVLAYGDSIHIKVKGLHLVEGDPHQGVGFVVRDLPCPLVDREIMEFTEFLGAMEERTDIVPITGNNPEFLAYFLLEGTFWGFARLQMPTHDLLRQLALLG